jgi:hypothetical protein
MNFLRNFYNGFLNYNGFTTDFWGFIVFGPFDPEFKGVIENLEVDREGRCFKDIKMRLGYDAQPCS